MPSQKIVREVRRVYARASERGMLSDATFEHARFATVQRLCDPIAVAFHSDPMAIELRLFEHAAAQTFAATMLDEMLLWQPPHGATLLEELLAERQISKRPIARQFLESLSTSTTRLWYVVDARSGQWASVHRFGGEEPPRRVELLDDTQRIATGDCVAARRIKLDGSRVFADGWLAFPSGAIEVLRGMQGIALVERAFCLWALMALGDQDVTVRWLDALTHSGDSPGTGPDDAAHRDRAAAGRSRDRSTSRPPPRRATGTAGTDPERERLLERIRKLFAMAQETESSPHEAEIALRRCQSLMTRFGITEADLESSEFGVASVATGRTVATHVKLLGGAVALLHDVIFVIGRGGLAEFRGYEIDVQVATMTFEFLGQAIERALSTRKRRGELPPGRSAAFDYRVAFASEVHERVHLIAAEREAAERHSSGSGTALAVRKREQVDREFGEHLVEKPLRVRGPRDDEAAEVGREDGRQVSLDPQID